MKRLAIFICLVLTVVLAAIVGTATNSGVDLLVATWILGGITAFISKSYKANYLTLGVIVVTIVYVLVNTSNWSWNWLDYAVVIERLLAVITTVWSMKIQKNFPA